jgi:hypothetical protein
MEKNPHRSKGKPRGREKEREREIKKKGDTNCCPFH